MNTQQIDCVRGAFTDFGAVIGSCGLTLIVKLNIGSTGSHSPCNARSQNCFDPISGRFWMTKKKASIFAVIMFRHTIFSNGDKSMHKALIALIICCCDAPARMSRMTEPIYVRQPKHFYAMESKQLYRKLIELDCICDYRRVRSVQVNKLGYANSHHRNQFAFVGRHP
ncbi:hypothetical protein Bhyg_15031 [Pseudolycoriella hygida]|uniref:Uncharacterized protein n=1 Tax=Pseudolycoriella hygida TaxID=35572 RepID=A0A9Q0MR36_9DIPT|nr:hypothetical protein Bhyg_15031 [Pseudolycoriella hygida]